MENRKATINELNGLHDKMAVYFTMLLSSGKELSSGELSSILKFLKDNEITAEVIESKPMANLVQSFIDNEEALLAH